jgi:hypothetical protein
MIKKLFFVMAVSVFTFSACKKKTLSDEEIITQILGTWEGKYATGEGVRLERSGKTNSAEQTFTFNEDGSYEITRGEEPYVAGKSYFIKNGTVYLQHLDKFWTIEKLTSSKLKFIDQDGNELKYKKK